MNKQQIPESRLVPKSEINPMENNIVHWLLVHSNRLQRVPTVIIPICITIGTILIWLSYGKTSLAEIASLVFMVMCFVDWGSLWLLPRAGRSFGPEKPSTLALIGLRIVLMLVAKLLAMPLWVIILGNIGLTAVAIYATWIEPFRLGVTYQHFYTRKLRASASPIRLLHIADIHIERISARERRLNKLILELKPDVIVFSGDFVNISYTHDEMTKQDIRTTIGQWSAPLGVYCVPGTYTVEPIERVKEFVAGLDNICLLLDEWVSLETPSGKLNILGMVTTHYLEIDRPKVSELLKSAPSNGVKLLLTHAPDVAPEADSYGYDLYLCGHTHGGQLRLPFIGAIFTGSQLGRRFAMGRHDLHNITIYTSRGVGLEGMGAPRARFLCPPEIIHWEIRGQ